MRKAKDILIFVFLFIVIAAIGFGVFLFFDIQEKYAGIPSEKTELVTEEKTELNMNLVQLLENPIDLQKFKNKKNRKVTTSVSNGRDYYFQPKVNDSIFYSYNFITDTIENGGINNFIVFKHGKNKHTFIDSTETLIELKIFNKDSDLEKLNLIEVSLSELELKFGTDYILLDNEIVYSYKNKVLIFELVDSKVLSFNYIKLNTENIDKNLIDLII